MWELELIGGLQMWPATYPEEAGDGEQDTGDARDLGDSIRARPEAVDAQGLDEQSPHRVQADVPEEDPSRPVVPSRPDPPHEQGEHHEIPQRFIEEGGVEALHAPERRRPARRRYVETPREIRRPAERLLVEEIPPAPDGLRHGARGPHQIACAQDGQAA